MELRARNCLIISPKFRLPRKFWDLLHAADLRHGTDGFTSPPKEGMLRICFNKLENKRKIFMKLFDIIRHTYTMILNTSIDRKSGRRKLSGFNKSGVIKYVCFWRDSPQWARASSFTRFSRPHTTTHTFGRTPLDE